MKLQKLLLIVTFMVFSTGNIFAQNNDMKARMEYEDAETAYSNQNYSKAIEHLENAEKFLGKATAKTRYLLILSLSKNLSSDYEYKDLEKLRTLCKHYLDNYTTDTEKYRDIYDLSNNLNKNYPKSLEEYNKFKQEQEEQQKRLAIEKREREELERVERIKKSQKYVLDLARKYNYQPNLTLSKFAALSENNRKLINKIEKKIKKTPTERVYVYDKIGVFGNVKIPYVIGAYKGKIDVYGVGYGYDSDGLYEKIKKELYVNVESKFYTISDNKIIIKIPNIYLDEVVFRKDGSGGLEILFLTY
jgi:hypothetical protein